MAGEFTLKVDIDCFRLFPKFGKYRSMVDELKNFSYVFHGGKMYGLVGECGTGGWGLSYLLSGRDFAYDCKVLVNDCPCSQDDLKRYGWYVGEGLERRYSFLREKSVIEQIRHGLKITSKCEEREIIKKFGLSERRLNCKLSNLSGERMRASVAIGYAHDCKIFCFAWHNNLDMDNQITSSRIEIYTDILKSEGNIVIIPVEDAETLDMMADELIFLDEGYKGDSKSDCLLLH